eukprot:747458-Hanusia_phi.AAC.1
MICRRRPARRVMRSWHCTGPQWQPLSRRSGPARPGRDDRLAAVPLRWLVHHPRSKLFWERGE